MTSVPKIVGFIPARSGSKRVPHKNIAEIEGHPLLAYSIRAAVNSNVFDSVVLCTDSPEYAEIGRHYGAEVPFLRDPAISSSVSPDIEWIEMALAKLAAMDRNFDAFSILRPTSPFRKPETIKRAWSQFTEAGTQVDSLRAVEKCAQHPGKMWVVRANRMNPLLPMSPDNQPFHSTQYAALPEVFVQNACLEIAWTKVVEETHTIAGQVIMPFFTEGDEGVDINTPEDWWLAEHMLKTGAAKLPSMSGQTPFGI